MTKTKKKFDKAVYDRTYVRKNKPARAAYAKAYYLKNRRRILKAAKARFKALSLKQRKALNAYSLSRYYAKKKLKK